MSLGVQAWKSLWQPLVSFLQYFQMTWLIMRNRKLRLMFMMPENSFMFSQYFLIIYDNIRANNFATQWKRNNYPFENCCFPPLILSLPWFLRDSDDFIKLQIFKHFEQTLTVSMCLPEQKSKNMNALPA